MNPVRSLCILLCLCLLTLPAFAAERAPITIEADSAEIDDRRGVSIYTGNVIIIQEGLKIKADVVTAHTKDGELLRVEAEGKPVKFEQQRENEDTIRGQGLTMDYDAKTERLLLLKQAQLWQDHNHFRGERIQYDVNAKRALANSGDIPTGQKKPRVQITIQPKKTDSNN